ncbi:UNVERIFIED_CONTAM: Photosystem II reaction center PSB28 protein, chloroplastic [Sesamum radiatum]|uniref:Photosystem II reaction center Psb28 protein n=1 Tax=Sesamum radiatum TaxID=300843 RepID=A0AAW2UQQ6_SESRA
MAAAAVQSLVFSSPISRCSHQPRSFSGLSIGAIHSSASSSFNGQSLHLPRSNDPRCQANQIEDGTNGMAIFTFTEPSVFDSSSVVGDITGFYMIDEEGVLQSVDVNAKFVNGKPAGVEAKYVMRTPRDWDRFMRFMERYANANGLSFVKK